MKILQGVSALTFIAAFVSGMAIHWFLVLDLPVYAKVLCVSLLLLSSLLLFLNDADKTRLKENMKK
jgi:hypothetical protein